ncbi:hypothetical protein GDO86_017127 [Hymenochirus boettgeri]|uniref:Carboxypeptidase O n=1 Tax=Hymenochirus boettgeri TaxID=247094 RepID=A0A8T2IP09_9PIPI|nr:hypothetical protein GDO86_017127 [Hymenochirus boettgeri]
MIEDITAGREIHVRIPFTHVRQFKKHLLQQMLPFEILINDVQEVLDQNFVIEPKNQKVSLSNYDYTKYHPMEEIYDWMKQIEEKHSDLVKMHYLGSTFETRPIYYFKIGWPSDKTKKIVFMDCGIHAREWIAVAYCQWFVKEILLNHKDPLLTNILTQVDFFVVPVLNIDGYVYSWTTERLWRKNRTPHNNGTCYGVDLNRNFNSAWCTVGASTNCSSLTFCGSAPESERETKAVVSLIEKTKKNILFYLGIHSYGQYILLPYGSTKNHSANHKEMMDVAEKAVADLKEKHNNLYKVGPSSVVLYENSGSTCDWAADIGIKFSYIFELRDNGTYGFQLPKEQIRPTCEETMTAVMSMMEYANKMYLDNSAVAATFIGRNVLFLCAVCVYYVSMY